MDAEAIGPIPACHAPPTGREAVPIYAGSRDRLARRVARSGALWVLRMTYQVGKVYIWQNQVGQYAFINGAECTVIGPEQIYIRKDGGFAKGWPTDMITGQSVDNQTIWRAFAQPGDLRPKEPPSGEQSIMDQFKLPVREPELV